MDWHQRWGASRLGFHKQRVNTELQGQADWFLDDGPHGVFVPLCGKTLDLSWLTARGHAVVAVELVDIAVEQLHDEQGMRAVRSTVGPFELWRSPGLSVLQGDIFDLSPEIVASLPEVRPLTRCWDRAALIALPPEERTDYVRVVRSVLEPQARVLLTNFEYTAPRPSGPPYDVGPPELRAYFDDGECTEVAREDLIDSEPRWRERGMTRCESATFRIQLP